MQRLARLVHLHRVRKDWCFRHCMKGSSAASSSSSSVGMMLGKSEEPQLVSVVFVDPNVIGPPIRTTLHAPVGSSIVDVAKEHGIDIHAACGQKLQCATCHVIVKPEFYQKLQHPGVREEDLLESTFTLTPTSRLGCQVKLTSELDGLECMLPRNVDKGSVRMTVEQPRERVEKQWTAVPAVARPMAQNSRKEEHFELERLRKQLDDQRALSAHLESEIRQLRITRGASIVNGLRGEGAADRMRDAAGKAVKVARGLNSQKDSGGDDTEEGFEKIKAELASTRIDVNALGCEVNFDDVVGLEMAKRAVREAVMWPAIADASLFQGLRGSPKGLLLYGPPGCGKTMLARAAATELKESVSFFHIRPGDVMSKFYGDSQRRVLALEELVRETAPAVVFLDEVDTLLGSRDGERVAEHHRATVNALLAWMDGFRTGDERIFFVGATNRPEAIDEAALRRFGEVAEVDRPSLEARLALLELLAFEKAPQEQHRADLTLEDLQVVAERTEGFSFADIDTLTRRAFYEVLRQLPAGITPGLKPSDVPPVTMEHFKAALSDSTGTSALRKMLKEKGAKRAQL